MKPSFSCIGILGLLAQSAGGECLCTTQMGAILIMWFQCWYIFYQMQHHIATKQHLQSLIKFICNLNWRARNQDVSIIVNPWQVQMQQITACYYNQFANGGERDDPQFLHSWKICKETHKIPVFVYKESCNETDAHWSWTLRPEAKG